MLTHRYISGATQLREIQAHFERDQAHFEWGGGGIADQFQ